MNREILGPAGPDWLMRSGRAARVPWVPQVCSRSRSAPPPPLARPSSHGPPATARTRPATPRAPPPLVLEARVVLSDWAPPPRPAPARPRDRQGNYISRRAARRRPGRGGRWSGVVVAAAVPRLRERIPARAAGPRTGRGERGAPARRVPPPAGAAAPVGDAAAADPRRVPLLPVPAAAGRGLPPPRSVAAAAAA